MLMQQRPVLQIQKHQSDMSTEQAAVVQTAAAQGILQRGVDACSGCSHLLLERLKEDSSIWTQTSY